jgi:acyl dehydratase
MTLKFSQAPVGTELPPRSFALQRADLVRYAGASGDFNPIHWSEETAVGVGLPNVIAHGMLTMAVALRVVTDWLGDPGAVRDYSVRFTRPVVVAFGVPTELAVSGRVRSVDEKERTATVEIVAAVDSQTVLAKARVIVGLED